MSILRIVGSTWANLWAVYKNSSLKPVFRQILWKFLWFCPVIFCSEIFRAEWIIQFYMLFHILFFRWKQSIPTTFHILASYIEKTTTNWRYFPQITKALNYVILTVLHQKVWPWEKMATEYSQIWTFLFCLQCCDLVQQVQNCFHRNL